MSPLVLFAIVGLAFVVGVGLLLVRVQASVGRTPRTRYLQAMALAWGASFERVGPLGFEAMTLGSGAARCAWPWRASSSRSRTWRAWWSWWRSCPRPWPGPDQVEVVWRSGARGRTKIM